MAQQLSHCTQSSALCTKLTKRRLHNLRPVPGKAMIVRLLCSCSKSAPVKSTAIMTPHSCPKLAGSAIALCSWCTLSSFNDALALMFKTAISSKVCSSTGMRLQ